MTQSPCTVPAREHVANRLLSVMLIRFMERCVWLLLLSLMVGLFPAVAMAADDEQSAELKKQQQIADKFLSVLVKNPRRGTALDRVYGHYVEAGTLDQFVADLKQKAESSPDDATNWMMLGLIEAQRGGDTEAIEAFQQAEKKNSKNAMASYYMGLSQNLLGQPEEAVASMERAIERRPPPADLLEIYQQLGRIHQRAQRNDEALKVWSRLESDFPNDIRVQEQIAVSLLEEGRFDQALPRYEALSKQVKDDYRRTVFGIQSAELKIKLGQREEGLKALETKLGELNPDSWLHRDIRRKIEDVYLRSGDQDGLVGYYEKWIGEHADDVDAMARLARFLARSARVPEATTWLEKALKLAPSRKELRIAFIEQLVDDQRYAEAGQQYELLDKADPNNPDYLREWGRVILRDKQRPKEERVAAAEAIWTRLAASKPKDPLIATQVADLLRHQEISESALKLYRQAVELSPDEPQYREYLGEYLHLLKKPEEAMSVWREIVAGKRHNVTNVVRLAEILMNHGFPDEAVKSIAEACELDAKDFSLKLKAADFHVRAQQYPAALGFIEGAEKLSANDDEREIVLTERVKVLQASNTLDDQIEALAARSNQTAYDWYVLARYYEADRRSSESAEAIQKSLELDAKSIPALTAAARILEQSGGVQDAADRFRQLAEVDRRYRSEHLSNVARLEAQLGRTAEALAAGKQLIAAAPGNTTNYVTYAELCFRLGQYDEGLDTLRKAIRLDPNEISLLTNLGSKLADQLRTNEAIQTYWQAFEKTESNDERLGIVVKLTDLHLQLNQLDKLVERLERDRREENKRRAFTICLAQVHQTAGDFGMARQELESLLSRETRDSELLNQLAKLCQSEQDLESAIQFQQQLVRVAPGPETEMALAQLYQSAGYREEASALFQQNAAREESPTRRLKGIDSLLRNSDYDLAGTLIENLLREQPQDWELLYRDGYAWASREKFDEAKNRFQRILDLDLPLETAGIELQDRQKQEQLKAKTNAALGRPASNKTRTTPFSPIDRTYDIQRATRMVNDYGYNQNQSFFMPSNYGEARMACLGWKYRFEELAGHGDEFVAAMKKAANESNNSRVVMDWIYLSSLRQDGKSQFEASKKLAMSGSKDEQFFFLSSLEGRTRSPDQVNYYNNSARKVDTTPPLSDEDLDLLLKCIKANSAPVNDPNSMQAYRRSNFLLLLGTELKRAHRDTSHLIEEHTKSDDLSSLSAACKWAANQQQVDKAIELYSLWSQKWLAQVAKQPRSQNYYLNPTQVMTQLMGRRALEKANDDILKIMDKLLDHNQASSAIVRTNAKRSSNSGRNQRQPTGVSIWHGDQQNYIQIDQPLPNEFLDQSSLMVLRQAYESFKRNDVLSDLPPYLKKRAEKATGVDRVAALQAVAAVLWWNDEKEDAATQFAAAAELVPQDQSLKLELASVHAAMGDYDAALEAVDRIVPRDQNLLQSRELLALQFAERLGDADRARAAAERLFGVRLDAQAQLSLAGHMRRLGLNGLAEAITSRAQRTSGNQINSQLTLMTLYQGQGKSQEAIQLAHQILRRTTPSQTTTSRRVRSNDQNDQARQQALQFLNQTGQLPDMIARLEKAQATGHASSRTNAQLAEVYAAAGKRDKALEMAANAVKQQPNDVTACFQYAQQLEQAGKTAEACDQYLIVLKSKPELMSDDIWRYTQLFQQAQKNIALAETMETLDLKRTFRHPSYVMNLIQPLMQNQETRPAGIKLLRQAIKNFASTRGQIFQSIYQDDIWDVPEVFEMALQSVVPSRTETVTRPWQGLDQINSYNQNGRANSSISKVIESAKRLNKLDQLRKSISEREGGLADWPAGKLYLALIDAKEGKVADAEQKFKDVLSDEDVVKSMPSNCKWIIAQELESIPDLRPRAIALLEEAVANDDSGIDFQYSPAVRLIDLLNSAGRRDDALKLMREAMKSNSNRNYDQNYENHRKIQKLTYIGEEFLKLNSPVDSARAFRELLTGAVQFEAAAPFSGYSAAQLKQRAERGYSEALVVLQADTTGENMKTLLTFRKEDSAGGSAIDFMVMPPEVTDLSRSKMSSALINLIKTLNENSGLRDNVLGQIEKLKTEEPDDVSVAITRCLLILGQKNAEASSSAARELVQFAESHPLDEIEAGKRANQRQRSQALNQIPIWFVARACLEQPSLTESGEKLAARSLLAARRQFDFNYAASILHEWATLEWSAGRKEMAEQHWSELLDAVTVRPKSERKKSGDAEPGPKAKPGAPRKVGGVKDNSTSQLGLPAHFSFLSFALVGAPPVVAAPKGPETVIPPLTIPQFESAMSLAKVAAEHQLQELSFRAVEEALKAGPPIQVAPDSLTNPMNGPRTINRPNRQGQLNEVSAITPESFALVARSLRSLAVVWEANQFSPKRAYAVLLPIVLPPPPSTDVKIYLESDGLFSERPTSLATTLVALAKRAEKLDELKKAASERAAIPASALNSQAILALIALQERDDATATELFNKISTALKADPLPDNELMACHLAVLGFERETLRPVVTPLITKILQTRQKKGTSADGAFLRRLYRYLGQQKNIDIAKARFEEYLTAKLPQYSGNGEYGLYQQKQDLTAVAVFAISGGLSDLALEYLGRATDMPLNNYGSFGGERPFWAVLNQLMNEEPSQVYSKLSDWTLPKPNRKLVRFDLVLNRPFDVPALFLTSEQRKQKHYNERLTLSTFGVLADAALQCGKFEELLENSKAIVSDEIPLSQQLYTYLLLRKGDIATATPLLKEMIKKFDNRPRQNRRNWHDLKIEYLLVQAAMERPELRTVAHEYARIVSGAIRSTYYFDLRAPMDAMMAGFALADLGLPPFPFGKSPDLSYWEPIATGQTHETIVPTTWIPRDDQLFQVGGGGDDVLVTRFPIQGDFEFTVDTVNQSYSEGAVGYAGVLVLPDTTARTQIRSISGHESIGRPDVFDRRGDVNRVTVRHQDDKLQFLINGQLQYEETAVRQSPWLTLRTTRTIRSLFRNPQLSGKPIIPKEVSLIEGNRLDGWSTNHFGDAQPRRRLLAETPSDEERNGGYNPRNDEPTTYDWEARDGELIGNRRSDKGLQVQSRINYFRPLSSGDKIHYEFLYEPGTTEIHPSIGMVAYTLSEKEVRLHWMTRRDWDFEIFGVDPTNLVGDPKVKTHAGHIPLKAGEWNSMDVSFQDQTLKLMLNDQLIYERDIPSTEPRTFGFFRYKDAVQARIRNIKLTGDWPTEVPAEMLGHAFATKSPVASELDQSRDVVAGDAFIRVEAYPVWLKSLEKTDPERFEALLKWVVPNSEHLGFRLYSFEIPESVETTGTYARFADGARVTGPCHELIAVAQRLKRLDELQKAVDGAPEKTDAMRKAKTAMQAMVAAARNQNPLAQQYVRQLISMIDAMEYAITETERYPEYSLIMSLLDRPQMSESARELTQKVIEKYSAVLGGWSQKIRPLESTVLLRFPNASAAKTVEAYELKQWKPAVFWTVENRGNGTVPTKYFARRGEIGQYAGDAHSVLFYQSPLRGDFELTADVSVSKLHEGAIGYGMMSVSPNAERKEVSLVTSLNGTQKIKVEYPAGPDENFSKVRLVSKDQKATWYVNGTEVRSVAQVPSSDPWLALLGLAPYSQATIRNVQITGNPTIPDSIDLTSVPDLVNWRADEYGERLGQEKDQGAQYFPRGDELIARMRKDRTGKDLPSLLVNQRPLTFDGELTYEFFYVPKEFEVHPAFGRTSWLISPNGVHRKRLNNAQWEPLDQLSKPAEPPTLVSSQSPKLKEQDWNKVSLIWQGASLKISVNDQLLVTDEIDSRDSPQFGLFRHGEQNQFRVRNMKLMGKWPTTLPSVADQELALPTDAAAVSQK